MHSLLRVVWGWMSPHPGWFDPVGNPGAPAPRLDAVGGQPCVVVAGVGASLTRNAVFPALWTLAGAAALPMTLTTFQPWYALIPAALMTVCARPAAKLLVLPPAEPGFLVTPDGILTGDLVIPWSAILTFQNVWMWGPNTRLASQGVLSPEGWPARRWNLITVHVTDFTSVAGLPPAVAGLANLSRRRLLILAAASEVHDPTAVADALCFYAANPEQRHQLATPLGASEFAPPHQALD